ncbi:motility associated factor glycosyltransferase family protein [Brachyspira sp. SAP_772]|uniref:motility associated factor glycosyltransferase family protein n=1 Tax=Brachyspira sp. SAP_772 TaxID=2608385 RepID=UPI0012F50669|nr:6-hydroxymethylpterin diphosphokinase MptE-like protein [Brachyspira sp. SAP_772]
MILKKNIEVLKLNKYNINAIKKIENVDSNDSYEIKFNKNNFINVSYKNKALTSLYAPIEEAKRLIEQYIKNNDADYIAIFLSVASFYHIDYFLSLNTKNKAIIIEKDIELLKLILSNIDIKNADRIIILSEEKDILLFFNNFIKEDNVKKLVVIRHIRVSNISEENKNYYDNITIQLSNIIKERLMSLTSNYYFAPIWARNIIYNMHSNYSSNNYSIESFKNYLNKETPLLLVSAGASIDNYIEKIKELSESHFVLAVSHSLNTLLNNNIKPNAVVSTDGGFYSLIHILNLFKEESILLFTTHTSYPVNSIKKERKFFFSHNESLEKILYNTQDNIYFPMEGSVIMPALRIAEFLNPKYILLAGCDFCHVDDKSHSEYSNAIALDFITSNKINTFETKKYKRLNDDNKIKCFDDCLRNTSSSLLSYKAHFESLIAYLSKNIDFFTLTKESAKIKNVNIYDNIKNSNNKQLKDFNYIEEKQNKELLKNKLSLLITNINSNNFSDDINTILNMISPWHRDAFIEGKIKYDELKDYINKWYDDVYDLID